MCAGARRRSAAGAVAGLALSLAACGHEAPPAPAHPAAGPPRALATTAVERTGDGGVAVPAVVQARQRAALVARIPASVLELPWREGDRVSAGAVVARLDDAAPRAALAAAEAAAQAASTDRARVEALLAKGAATPREADESRVRAAGAAAGVAAAREGLAYAVLRAPFEGTIASRPTHVGDVVTPGTVLVEVEGTGGLELKAFVEGDAASRLRPGLVLEASVDGQPGPLPATVRAVSVAGDPATHRFEVRADVPRAAGLRSGLFARLVVPSSGGARLLVPTAAVVRRGGLGGVFVVEGGAARLRWVALGSTTGTRTEVRAGLDAGERVALEPAGLVDGQAVADAAPGSR
jgi:membrane fusion protein, multidrug efflux system